MDFTKPSWHAPHSASLHNDQHTSNAPAVATPVPTSIAPELPVLAEPVLKISMPLTPLVPELMDRIVMAPLDVDVPSPLLRLTAPPVCTVLRPAYA